MITIEGTCHIIFSPFLKMWIIKINIISVALFIISLVILNVNCCQFKNRLRGKWYFTGESKNTNIRIKNRIIIFKVSHYIKLRYKCIERMGNIYLLQNTARRKKHEVLCLGFIYVADNPHGEFLLSRMIEQGFDSFIFSPKNVSNPRTMTIENTCDSEISRERKFIYRKENRCRLPQEMVGTWGFTLRQSSAITMGKRNLTIHFLNNQNLKLNCESRDGNMFLFRRPAYVNSTTDAILCVTILPVLDDPFYNYEFTRIISGNTMENLIRLVPRGKPMNIHIDCNMIESPARPEFIYTVDNII